MLNRRLAGAHLYWKLLFTWLSLVMYLMVSLFPRVVFTKIWDLINFFLTVFLSTFPSYDIKASTQRLKVRKDSVKTKMSLRI